MVEPDRAGELGRCRSGSRCARVLLQGPDSGCVRSGRVARQLASLPVPEDQRSHPESVPSRANLQSLQPDAVATMGDFARLSLVPEFLVSGALRAGEAVRPALRTLGLEVD